MKEALLLLLKLAAAEHSHRTDIPEAIARLEKSEAAAAPAEPKPAKKK